MRILHRRDAWLGIVLLAPWLHLWSMFRSVRLLGSRRIATLFWSQVLSSGGDQLYTVAVVWTAVQLGGSSAGWVVAAQSFAALVFGLFGGVVADRFDRRRLL